MQQLLGEEPEALIGLDLPLDLGEPRPGAELQGFGLALDLGGESVIGTVARMLALGATTAGLSTGAEDLCDSASTHVTELSDLAKDGFALGQEWGKQVWHGRSYL